ncbi:MAG: 16S rRNA (adenine(1518)-N(6)/adenine(1519)-N(6))-dimethyltransferase RsmA [Anaerococcus vaginalis]|uniref:16S rRNA (adenine(1518)-N(6)/adenine(1519)-N(6))- dimethyltransferase RsmA n=1 Tax=Anaerococcus vaginalis TaxID=33037 RepID=UPI00290AA1F7|nr:16S rRNA (adenine(1518)-N(6)/adenine(1519)-N(6))-dimethyltransferase RsmA [Anaerococcus vaginalis]MDU5086308.1 16S rRNA (adenine(1518)-N(6)/adenine(1519)-N(6))-dimethyltransferase RsmA [Anaerococcus vaginalis]
MKKLYSPKTIKLIQDLYGFKFSKSLGQNFLVDKNFVDKIIDLSEVSGENILEIGPGIGTISQEMAKTCKKLVVIEIDKTLIPILNDNLGEFSNVEIINADILKTDLKKIAKEKFDGEDFKVVSNLPYYITTPIIEKLFEEDLSCKDMTIMVQKEVADRMKADEKSKDYSSLSVFIKYYAEITGQFKVPKSVFMPQPKIDSQVLKLNLRLYDKNVNTNTLFNVVRAGFNKRRKTILNSLSSVIEKENLKEILGKLDLKENLRAENLSLDDFIKIANELEKIKG